MGLTRKGIDFISGDHKQPARIQSSFKSIEGGMEDSEYDVHLQISDKVCATLKLIV